MATRATFLQFLRDAGFSSASLPDNSPVIDSSLAIAGEFVSTRLAGYSQLIYDDATHNLAAHYLVERAPDQNGRTDFADFRKTYQISSPIIGVVTSASDNGTSASRQTPSFVQSLSQFESLLNKTPFGQRYLGYASQVYSGVIA